MLILGFQYPKIIGSIIKHMSTIYSLNTLGDQPLVSGPTSTFLLKTYDLILNIFFFSQPICIVLTNLVCITDETSVVLPQFNFICKCEQLMRILLQI
jgi:hypothetical protein